jgi:hypothetical protein
MAHARKEDLQHRMYICTFHEVDTLRERRHVCDVRANTTVGNKAVIRFEAPR